jgi:Phosphatidylethanolamine-binding protein
MLAEGAASDAEQLGFKQAINDFHRPGYGGPCPPRGHGLHHYHFRLLALSLDHLPVGGTPSCRKSNARHAGIPLPKGPLSEFISDDGSAVLNALSLRPHGERRSFLPLPAPTERAGNTTPRG